MKDNFEKALTFTLFWEGGYVNNINDTGGETNYGICKRAYPDLDIKHLTPEQAKTIYLHNYWNKLNCDGIPQPMDIVIFDIAVNLGISRTHKILEDAIDWKDALILRLDYYDGLKIFKFFGTGWSKRIVSLRDYIVSNFTTLERDRKESI